MSRLAIVASFVLAIGFMARAARAEDGAVKGTVRVKSESLFSDSSVAGAVVYLERLEGVAPAPTVGAELAQKNKAFEPRQLVVQSGTTIRFPNKDKIYHNVFSLSAGSEFDLGLYSQGASKSVKFTKSGVIDVFCNIHPDMVASILVLQNPHYTTVGKDGAFTLPLPPGSHTLVAWWSKGPAVKRDVVVEAGKTVEIELELSETGQVRHLNKHGQPYGRYK